MKVGKEKKVTEQKVREEGQEKNQEKARGQGGKTEFGWRRKTKIIATLGPASFDEKIMERMIRAGMNAARFNFSHGDHDQHRKAMASFRKIRDKLGVSGAVILDTKGPEIRLKTFRGGSAFLEKGKPFCLTTDHVEGTETLVSVAYHDFCRSLTKGDTILIDDGKIELRVTASSENLTETTVIRGGTIKDHKGINLPHVRLDMPYISQEDKEDLLFGVEENIDYVAASFVRRAEDVITLRKLLGDHGGGDIKIIAKIESTEGVANFDEILEEADGIMVARGDLGVEIAFEKIPGMQKAFIKKCMEKGKIAITATQMLESMVQNPFPTRAETTDVANAVFDGTSAVMLSGESASGDYPVEAVDTMARICLQAEKDQNYRYMRDDLWTMSDSRDVTNAIAHAATTLARDIGASALMAATNSGFTASCMSKFRPDVPIIGATPLNKSYHQMGLYWGVIPIKAGYRGEIEDLYGHFASEAVRKSFVKEGSLIVISAGLPVESHGKSNAIRVVTARERRD